MRNSRGFGLRSRARRGPPGTSREQMQCGRPRADGPPRFISRGTPARMCTILPAFSRDRVLLWFRQTGITLKHIYAYQDRGNLVDASSPLRAEMSYVLSQVLNQVFQAARAASW